MVSFVDTLPTLIDRPSSDIFASNGFSIPHPPSLNLLQLIQPIEQSHDSNFYCAPCKRAFSSQSTWRTHQGTARHLTITKENQRKRERTPKRSRSQAQSPALVEANLKLQQAEKLVSSNPHLAATIFWGIAAVFWSNGCVRDTAKCLTNLMSILDSDTGPAPGPTSPGREPPMALKPSQILETLYLARLTLARLMAMYDCDVAMALYLEALDGRYDTDLDALSLKCEDSAFLEVCSAAQETYLGKVEPKLMKSKKLASKSTVPVLEVQSALGLRKRKLASILLECLGFAVNLEAHDEALAVGALYLAVISGVDSMESEFTSCCARLADVYIKSNRIWSACDALVLAANTAIKDTHEHAVQAVRSLTDSMILALLIGDFQRCQELEEKADQVLKLEILGSEREPLDVKFIRKLSEAVRNQDFIWFSDAHSKYELETLCSESGLLYEDAPQLLNALWSQQRTKWFQG